MHTDKNGTEITEFRKRNVARIVAVALNHLSKNAEGSVRSVANTFYPCASV